MKNESCVAITSGGLDSTVLIHHLKERGYGVRALGINYGQRHGRELDFAAFQADELGIPFTIANLSSLASILPGSSQTDSKVAVPHGHYEQESMKATVVPNRNMILLAVAIGHAIAYGCEYVAYAAHAGDHAIYPDCRPEFANAMEQVAGLCHYTPVKFLRPFINMTKSQIVRAGAELSVDFSKTYSCYEGRALHCGRCGTCVERRQAFILGAVHDPTEYQDPNYALSLMAESKS